MCRGILCITLMCLLGAPTAYAQSPAPAFEIGAHASLLRLSHFDATNAGIGGRLTVDLSNWLAADVEMTFVPNDDIAVESGLASVAPRPGPLRVAHHRRRIDGFFGIKAGRRGERFGAFARVRPGFTRLIDRGLECVGAGCALVQMLLVRDEYRSEFALDLGGGIEVYPSARTVARVEFGDTMIRHRSIAPPCPATRCTSHNFSTRVGGGYRF